MTFEDTLANRLLRPPSEVLHGLGVELAAMIDLYCEASARSELRADLECWLRKAGRAVKAEPRGISDAV